MSEPITSGRRLTATEKQAEALRLRKQGKSFDEIATLLGYSSKSGAHKAVLSALQKTLSEPAEELRTLECARLDAALAAIWPQVESGDIDAIYAMLKVSKRRSELLGLDGAQATDVNVTFSDAAESFDSRLAQLTTRLAAGEIPGEPDDGGQSSA
jgi:hypothetical protein